MKVNLMNSEFANTGKTLDINDSVMDVAYNEALIHQVVTSTLTNAGFGTKAQKTRAQVRGGGIKPWRQKGTGRARAGTIRSPLWRKGGVIFAATPKIYNQKINKKMYTGAMRSILSELNRADRLIVVESIDVEKPKTKDAVKLLQPYLSGRVTIIVNEFDVKLYLSSRNIPNVYMVDVESLDPVTLVGSDKVIVTVDALKRLEEGLV